MKFNDYLLPNDDMCEMMKKNFEKVQVLEVNELEEIMNKMLEQKKLLQSSNSKGEYNHIVDKITSSIGELVSIINSVNSNRYGDKKSLFCDESSNFSTHYSFVQRQSPDGAISPYRSTFEYNNNSGTFNNNAVNNNDPFRTGKGNNLTPKNGMKTFPNNENNGTANYGVQNGFQTPKNSMNGTTNNGINGRVGDGINGRVGDGVNGRVGDGVNGRVGDGVNGRTNDGVNGDLYSGRERMFTDNGNNGNQQPSNNMNGMPNNNLPSQIDDSSEIVPDSLNDAQSPMTIKRNRPMQGSIISNLARKLTVGLGVPFLNQRTSKPSNNHSKTSNQKTTSTNSTNSQNIITPSKNNGYNGHNNTNNKGSGQSRINTNQIFNCENGQNNNGYCGVKSRINTNQTCNCEHSRINDANNRTYGHGMLNKNCDCQHSRMNDGNNSCNFGQDYRQNNDSIQLSNNFDYLLKLKNEFTNQLNSESYVHTSCKPKTRMVTGQIDIIRLILLYLALRPNCRYCSRIATLANEQFEILLELM